MFNITEKILEKILKRKFISLVGGLCEKIEYFEKLEMNHHDFAETLKFELKKSSYDIMREIKEQISSFSEGTTVSVKFNKPTQE